MPRPTPRPRAAVALGTGLLLGAGLLAAPAALAAPAPAAVPVRTGITPDAPAVPGSVLVTYDDATSEQAKDAAVATTGATAVDTVGRGTEVLAVDPAAVADTVATLEAAPGVLAAEPNYLVRAADVPDDPSFGALYALRNTGQSVGGQRGVPGADIGATAAWDVTTGSRGVVVAVTDGGVDATHPDLAANAWSNPGGVGGCPAGTHGFDVVNRDCDPDDDGDHGTHVAGTVGAVGDNGRGVTGVAWQTSIMSVKFLDASGDGSTADAITAIDRVIAAKAAGVDVRVLNASWGGPGYSQALYAAVARARDAGILVVAAAGNGDAFGNGVNTDTAGSYPASFDLPNVVSVAATDNRDQLARFSDYGARTVDLAAPGVRILSTLPGGGYGYESGTSMAAPQVSGAAALLLANQRTLSTAPLKARLLGSVDPLPALAGRTVSGGRLDVCTALPGCSPASPPPDVPPALAPSSVALSTPGNVATGAAALTLTATVSPGSATGTVAFADGGTTIGGCAAVPVRGGRAVCVTTFATAGPHPVTVSYSGSPTVAASSSTTTLAVSGSPNLFQLLEGLLIRIGAFLGLIR